MLLSVRGRRAVHTKVLQGNGQQEPRYRLFFFFKQHCQTSHNSPQVLHCLMGLLSRPCCWSHVIPSETRLFHLESKKSHSPCRYWEQYAAYVTRTAPSQKAYKKELMLSVIYCNLRVFQASFVTTQQLSPAA